MIIYLFYKKYILFYHNYDSFYLIFIIYYVINKLYLKKYNFKVFKISF